MEYKETIWHFICDSCRNWWSISFNKDDHFYGRKEPKKLYCPYCKHEHAHENLTIGSDEKE